ncbi:hypothetical protein PG996_016050 [Apiospora saccharicola]|uniref:Heterokaryon incompatibility domain-containing protein n=1 Tax=Apiospora saccharicola TaxID=335842 RepID=A0ABR1TMW1_9PEZI
MAQSPYQPLNREKKQIRLFDLFPGKDGDPITGRLRVVSLTRWTRYDALSYVWGAPEPKTAVSLEGGQSLSIGPSLHLALSDLRRKRWSMTLWVDALCINQQDDEEKSHQVPMMSDIYRAARLTRAWLNHEIDLNCPALRALPWLVENKAYYDKLGIVVASLCWQNTIKRCLHMLQELESHDWNFWKPAIDILQNEYWSRVWIQQELVVSHEVRFHIRNVEITGRHLLRLRDNLVMSAVFANKTGADHPGNGIECGYTTFLSRISDRLVRAKRNKSNTPLIFLATKPIGMQASDPRDAIYGCLALANPSEINTLRVDYCLPLTQVYGDVIRNHLLYWKNLDFMSFRSRYSCAEYPTWLPMPERYISFEVCLRSEPLELDWLGIPASVSHDGLRLEVKACQLDTVTHISRKTAPGDAPIADDLQEILEYHHELHDDTIEGEVWASPSLSGILKWDIPLGFGLLPYEGVEKAIVDLLEVAKNDQHGGLDWYAALTSMINSPTVNEKLSNALQSVLLSIRWHLPIATHHGRLGLDIERGGAGGFYAKD